MAPPKANVLGGFQTDFAKNWSCAGGDMSSIVRDTALGALVACDMHADGVETIHVGNAFGELRRN
ncbi:MAG: hypothetical protein WCO67_23915 [Betaproteobacteria bacterium]|jgi:acetyl-CoA C-acetyltransferase